MIVMDYDIKANITTIVGFLILPVLSSLGIDALTGSAVVGVVSYVVVFVFMYFNERYLSKICTKEGYSVVKDTEKCVCPSTEEESVNPDYSSDEGA